MLNGAYTGVIGQYRQASAALFQVDGGERQLIAGTDRRNASSRIASVLYRYYYRRLSQCYTATVYTTTIRVDDRQLFLWRDVDRRAPTTTTEKSPRSSALLYPPDRGEGGITSPGGDPGVIKFIPSAYVLGFLWAF